jgi:hypothetical protein
LQAKVGFPLFAKLVTAPVLSVDKINNHDELVAVITKKSNLVVQQYF